MSYTGLLEPLGQSQVLPYVRGLAGKGHRMIVLSFERPAVDPGERDHLRSALAAEGVEWHFLRYHKRPPVLSTAFDVAAGVWLARRVARAGLDLVHARSHVAALIAEAVRKLEAVPFLFDHRGRMADEYADAGVWPRDGLLYRATERWEGRFLRDAAETIVLTKRYADELAPGGRRITVIPCAVDLSLFHPADRRTPPAFDLVHAGSWSGLYLVQETLRFFDAYRRQRPGGRLLVLVPRAQEVRPSADGVEFRQARPEEVPALLREAGAGLSLRRTGRAQTAASPVKVSEYLATGLPVVSSPGVGDLDDLLPGRRIGVVLPGLSEADLSRAVNELLALQDDEGLGHRCRAAAEEMYGLPGAVNAYDGAYRRILARGGSGPSIAEGESSGAVR